MRLATETEVLIPEELEFFPHFSVEATDKGTVIEARSPVFAAHINALGLKSNLPKSDLHKVWKGGVYQYPRDFEWNTYSVNYSNGFFAGESANLVWLLHPDLEKGFTLVCPEPLSLNNLEDYFTSACAELRQIYLTRIRRASFRATLKEYSDERKAA